MRAGDYRHRVEVQSKSATVDAVGQEIPSWATVGTYWAKVEHATGREYLAQGTAETATITARIYLRAHIGLVSTTSRLVWGERVYGIRYIANRDDDIEVGCFEVLNA